MFTSRKPHPVFLVFAPTPAGGLAEYTYYQARALHRTGLKLECLAARNFLNGRPSEFPIERKLVVPRNTARNAPLRRTEQVAVLLANQILLAWWIFTRRPKYVLLDSYMEYLAPIWIWLHILLSELGGVRYVANLHDPIRSYQVGPGWWHRWSVQLAYRPLFAVLAHHELPKSSLVPSHVLVARVPHGIFELPAPTRSRNTIRTQWGSLPSQHVFLSFGYVRDGKNMDFAVRALARLPSAFLVVAGSVASLHDRPFSYYRTLAKDLGVADRVHFFEGFVPDPELIDYFLGADTILLTYSANFHSQSGVLNLATRARRLVLASASEGPLLATVRQFQLGLTIQPDSAEAVEHGMRQIMQAPPNARWDDYAQQASWEKHATIVRNLLR